ncbi:hypothetical protein [Streptomyces sp. NPDC055036]
MARNLDEFSAELNGVIIEAAQKAVTRTTAKTVVEAAATGGAAAVNRLLEGMSTEEIQRLKQELER